MVFSKRKYSPLQMKGGALGDAIVTQWTNLSSIFMPVVSEVFRRMPDGILFGSAIFALLSQSFVMTMFVVSMLEASVVGTLLQKLMTYLDLATTLPNVTEEIGKCSSSIFAPSLESLMTFHRGAISSGFPSFPIFFMSTAAAYVVGSVWSQQRELEALGPEYAARFYIAVAVTAVLLFATMTFRLAYACDGAGILIVSAILGFVVGGLLIYQNNYLFGRDATNFSGVPLLTERTKDGKPLYVCTGTGKGK